WAIRRRARKIPHQCHIYFVGLDFQLGRPETSAELPLHFLRCYFGMLYDSRILKGASMARFPKYFVFLFVLVLAFSLRPLLVTMAGNPPAEGKEVALKAADISAKIFPERV